MFKFLLIFIFGFFLTINTAQAESIQAFDTLVSLNTDGSLNISESILYDYGVFSRHGIYRYLPLSYRYQDHQYQLSFDKIAVPDYPFSVNTDNDKLSLQIGDPEQFLTGTHVYNLNYQAQGAVAYYPNHDQIYLQLTGYGWPVEINSFSANFALPRALAADEITAACYAGAINSTSTCDQLILTTNEAGLVTGLSIRQAYIPAGSGLRLFVEIPKDLLESATNTKLFLTAFILLIIIITILWKQTLGKKQTIA